MHADAGEAPRLPRSDHDGPIDGVEVFAGHPLDVAPPLSRPERQREPLAPMRRRFVEEATIGSQVRKVRNLRLVAVWNFGQGRRPPARELERLTERRCPFAKGPARKRAPAAARFELEGGRQSAGTEISNGRFRADALEEVDGVLGLHSQSRGRSNAGGNAASGALEKERKSVMRGFRASAGS